MTIYILILAIIILFFCLYISENKNSKAGFELKKKQLKNDISSKNNQLKNQKERAELADELKNTIKRSNNELFSKIVSLNNSLFEEINKKNKNN